MPKFIDEIDVVRSNTLSKQKSSPITKPNSASENLMIISVLQVGANNPVNKATRFLEGAVLTITDPHSSVDNTLFPDAEFTKPTTYEKKITKVVNGTNVVMPPYKITRKSDGQTRAVPLNSFDYSITYEKTIVKPNTSGVFKKSYADIQFSNLQTFSGDVYKAKVFTKEKGSQGDYEKIGEVVLDGQNQLINNNGVTGFETIGVYHTQSIITDGWVTSSNLSEATQGEDDLAASVLLSGSNGAHASDFTFITKDSYGLQRGEDYMVSFDTYFNKSNKVDVKGDVLETAEIEVYLTGSAISPTMTSSEYSLGVLDNTFEGMKGRTEGRIDGVFNYFKTHNKAVSLPETKLGFRVKSGNFKLANVSLTPYFEKNFNPVSFRTLLPMPKPVKRGQRFDFYTEFYDFNNNKSNFQAETSASVVFDGAPQILGDGIDGLITGSIFLSSTQDSGIELHGGSAYIKSVGYPGFASASNDGVAGFMMFSGSVSKSLQTSESYEGVGIELISGSKGTGGTADKFLKFRTNAQGEAAEFIVQTDDFYLGKDRTIDDAQFISGSNGNVEISSSNFHLDTDGSVTMAGTITAEAGGTIGGFTINSTNLTATNFVLDTSGKSLAIGTGDDIAIIDSDSGIQLGNATFGSAPFRVNMDGELTATSVTITGDVNATGGTTAGAITALGAATQSLTDITGSVLTFTGSAQNSINVIGDATQSLTLITGSVLAFTGSAQTSLTFIGAATASLNVQSASFLAHSASMNQHSASVNTATGSLFTSTSALGVATASLIISRDAVNTETGSLQASNTAIGAATASLNTATSSLFTSTAALGVATASLSGSVQSINTETGSLQASTTAIGVATASLNTTSASLLAASESMQTQFSLSSTGAELKNPEGGLLTHFGLSTKIYASASNALQTSSANNNYTELSPAGLISVVGNNTASIFNAGGTTIQGGTATASLNAGGLTLISAGVTGSLFSATGAEIYGAADKNERVTISPAGVSVIANNITGSFVDANGMEIYGASDKNEKVMVNSTGVTIMTNNTTGSSFTAATSSIFGGTDKEERVEIVDSGMKVYAADAQVSSFGSTVVVGEVADDSSRVEISSGAVNIINRQGTTDTTMISFDDSGDISSGDFLIERTRLFGAGNDGGVKLLHNSASYSASGSGEAQGDEGMPDASTIKDEQGKVICKRSSAVWSLEGDCYFSDLEVDGATATTLKTNGFRLFVQNTLLVDSGCVIHNDGAAGSVGEAAAGDATTSGGQAGAGGGYATGSLSPGATGGVGNRGGTPGASGTNHGGQGGGSGGSGGIVFISARTITNNGTIRSHGGAGGAGGAGTNDGESPATAASAGAAGAVGTIIHIKV